MKIAFVSDIHSNQTGFATVLKELKGVDKIFCAGDITGYYPFPNEVIELLIKYNIICIKGNHDQYLLNGSAPEMANKSVKESVRYTKKIISKKNILYIKTLPQKLDFEIAGKKILICHGSPWDFLEGRIYPNYPNFSKFKNLDYNVVVMGNTHYPMIKKIGSKMIINPGSCGQPRDYNLLSYILWDTETNQIELKRVEWDIDKFKREALEKGVNPELFKVFDRRKEK